MAGFLKNIQDALGGPKASVSSVIPDTDDFADFATAASPVAPSHSASSAFSEAAPTGAPAATWLSGPGTSLAGRPYTKWYRVWERVTIQDFYQELIIIPIIAVIILVNMYGSSLNRRRARMWAEANQSLLESEFAKVGFGKTGQSSTDALETFYKEKSKSEYICHATGRQNVAWLDIRLTLHKRYNPAIWIGETVLSFFFDSIPAPAEKLEATAYCFDGREKTLVPPQIQATATSGFKDSTFDAFVWAIVHKNKMRQLRDDRYDISLTSTKDHPKLPGYLTVMSESAEVTETLLTPDLIKAVTEAGEDLEALVISDQPVDAPKKLNDTLPKKRISLTMRLDSGSSGSALFSYFLRMPDQLVSSAHFRSEALRKIKATRDEEQRKLRKIDEDEKAEERRLAMDKSKKEERDRKLNKMSAEEQRKFLEKEKEKNQRKGMKKQTMRA